MCFTQLKTLIPCFQLQVPEQLNRADSDGEDIELGWGRKDIYIYLESSAWKITKETAR
jgi:hypothetical protein